MHRIEETIARGICIGCGACSAASGGAVKVSLGPTRLYSADITDVPDAEIRRASRVCPFSDESPDENELGAPRGTTSTSIDPHLGQFISTFGGYVADDAYRMDSSSGGLTSWLCAELLRTDRIDGVIRVGRNSGDSDELFEYLWSTDVRNRGARKSQYYATTLAEVIETVRGSNKRFALIGVPCFIRAARSLARIDAEIERALAFYIGLVCGHYKTQAFAESLAWQVGVPPADLSDVDFRRKNVSATADKYDFAAQSATTRQWRSAPTRSLVGGNWGHNAFQPEACNFCDDVVGETADVSFGDGWLPEFLGDSLGTNVVVNRNLEIQQLFDDGAARGELRLIEVSPSSVIQSQAGGFRHRREGLAIRLRDDIELSLSVPRKRVNPDDAARVARRRVRLIRHRRAMARLSHVYFAEALRNNDLAIYLQKQKRQIGLYQRLESNPALRLRKVARSAIDTLTGWVRAWR